VCIIIIIIMMRKCKHTDSRADVQKEDFIFLSFFLFGSRKRGANPPTGGRGIIGQSEAKDILHCQQSLKSESSNQSMQLLQQEEEEEDEEEEEEEEKEKA
jgi:hypothetical protein